MLPFLLVGAHLKGTWIIEQSPDGPIAVQTDYENAFVYTEKWENGQLRTLTRDELDRECARAFVPVDDPWDVAASFLGLHTPADLVAFLNRTGTFSVATDTKEPRYLVQSFWALQDVLKEML